MAYFSGGRSDEDAWPKKMDLRVFKPWFHVTMYEITLDIGTKLPIAEDRRCNASIVLIIFAVDWSEKVNSLLTLLKEYLWQTVGGVDMHQEGELKRRIKVSRSGVKKEQYTAMATTTRDVVVLPESEAHLFSHRAGVPVAKGVRGTGRVWFPGAGRGWSHIHLGV